VETQEGSLASSVYSGGFCYPDIYLRLPEPDSWIEGMEATSFVYYFAHHYAAAQRGQQLLAIGLATVICLFLVL
jgi:hypothetical protein